MKVIDAIAYGISWFLTKMDNLSGAMRRAQKRLGTTLPSTMKNQPDDTADG